VLLTRWPRVPTLVPPLLPGRSEHADAALPAPLQWRSLMHFPEHDDFGDSADTKGLDMETAGFLAFTGAWCSRNPTDDRPGFIPAEVLAEISPEWERLADVLVMRNIWQRVWGGCQFLRWRQRWAPCAPQPLASTAPSGPGRRRPASPDAVRQALRRDPGLKEAVRAKEGDRCRFCSVAVRWGKGRAADSGAWELLDPDGRIEAANIAVSCMRCAAKRRARHGSSPRRHGSFEESAAQNRDELATGTVTDIDGFDQSGLSAGVGKSKSKNKNPRSQTRTRASEPRKNRDNRDSGNRDKNRDAFDAANLGACDEELCKRLGRIATPEETRHAKGVLDKRAEDAGTQIGGAAYYRTCIQNEADITDLLPPEPAPEVVSPQEAMTPQEAAKALGYNPDEFHEFDLDTITRVCKVPWCTNPRSNWRHNPAALIARTAS